MTARIRHLARLVTGLTLLALSVEVMRGEGFIRSLAATEMVSAAAFCHPEVWRIRGMGLLAVLAIAFTQHTLRGQFARSPLFASLVVTLELADERP
jgi:hypothetical protein